MNLSYEKCLAIAPFRYYRCIMLYILNTIVIRNDNRSNISMALNIGRTKLTRDPTGGGIKVKRTPLF